jgi:hypothetical protein
MCSSSCCPHTFRSYGDARRGTLHRHTRWQGSVRLG